MEDKFSSHFIQPQQDIGIHLCKIAKDHYLEVFDKAEEYIGVNYEKEKVYNIADTLNYIRKTIKEA